jgi:hypothetical protein
VLLVGAYGGLFLERLAYLRDRHNVEIGLVTEHASRHFRNPARERFDDKRLTDRVRDFRGPVEAYTGRLFDHDGSIVFSTDADDPHSFAKVFPELSRDLGARFIVPHPATSAYGWDPLDLVSPSPTRSGGGIYWAQRTLPNIDEDVGNRKYDGPSRQPTFAARISRVVEQAAHQPGLFWPIYTHLGGLSAASARGTKQREIPDPYFDPASLHALQDRVFNVSGGIAPESRIWFTRATVLYDYALILRSIANRVRRPDPNTIEIESWFDSVLERKLPPSPAQLYGLTFYVRDPAKAEVRLDGERVTTIVRNGRDQTGRYSITIGECDIRYIVFDRLDPMANAANGARLEGGEWQWQAQSDECFGRLIVRNALPTKTGQVTRGLASLAVPLRGWTPTGAQLLTFSICCDKSAHFSIVFRTKTGGVFFFGDRTMLNSVPDVTAAYCVHPRYRTADAWHSLTLPLHDLAWREGAIPGGPMPNHPLAGMSILCAAVSGSGICVGQMAFLRPRMTSRAREPGHLYCVGGALRSAAAEEGSGSRCHDDRAIVRLAGQQAGAAPTRTVAVNQRGHFCFDRIPSGIYRLWSPSPHGDVFDCRGPLVEVGADTMNFLLGDYDDEA